MKFRGGKDIWTFGVGLGGLGEQISHWGAGGWGRMGRRFPFVSITGKTVEAGDRTPAYVMVLQAAGVGAEYRHVELWNTESGHELEELMFPVPEACRKKMVRVPLWSGDVLKFGGDVAYRVRTPVTARKDHKRQKRVYLMFSRHGAEGAGTKRKAEGDGERDGGACKRFA